MEYQFRANEGATRDADVVGMWRGSSLSIRWLGGLQPVVGKKLLEGRPLSETFLGQIDTCPPPVLPNHFSWPSVVTRYTSMSTHALITHTLEMGKKLHRKKKTKNYICFATHLFMIFFSFENLLFWLFIYL